MNWLEQLLRYPSSIWNNIPLHILYKICAVDFFLVYNYDVCKIPFKLSAFYHQAFLVMVPCV